MFRRENIEFKSEGITLRGWFYTPDADLPAPCIIMTHGFSALKEHYLDKFASRFASSGMCVLVYDNRNFGTSDGLPRLEVDPIAQTNDMINAITFVQNLKSVINKKIGLWGTSFSGGIILKTAMLDKRISCLVAQVPFVSGGQQLLKQTKPAQWEKIQKKYSQDDCARLAGNPPVMIPVVTDKPDKPAVMKQSEAVAFFRSVENWENSVTLRSIKNAGEFELLKDIDLVNSSLPILFIVADHDTVNLTQLSLEAFSKLSEPKRLVLIEGDHFVPYLEQFDICINEACAWFEKYLFQA